jgi:galactose mutarotase-like enzyme
MSVKIENKYLSVRIKKKGAELYSLFNKENQIEYMWSGDPMFWGKTSPVLFPIVGTLKNNTFLFKDKAYNLSRHGFARDTVFELLKQTKTSATFSLKSNEESLKVYPFNFELHIKYDLEKDILKVTYKISNTGDGPMLFSIGAHPAFKIPLTSNTAYDDYYLEFETEDDIDHWPISSEGLIQTKSLPLLVDTNKLKITKNLFYGDALVLKNIPFNKISLHSTRDSYGLNFFCQGFPYFGIWAAKDADFICLEPWNGVADSVNHNNNFESKEGINKISSGELWKRTWSVQPF